MKLEHLTIDNYSYMDQPKLTARFKDPSGNKLELLLDPEIAVQIVELCRIQIAASSAQAMDAFSRSLITALVDQSEEPIEQEPFLSTEEQNEVAEGLEEGS